jgi:predicted regulator of Ras-like GTPase activity (Roadblock/LC7/MglB family)
MASIEETLRSLRDVQGVYGSFVLAGGGGVVAKDLPALYDGQLFAELGPRITRFYETFAGGGEELDACVLRYAEHKLYLRRMTWGLIGIVSAVAVNMPALRMVANLVIRRIDPEVAPSLRPGAPVTMPPHAVRALEPTAILRAHAHTPSPPPAIPYPPPLPTLASPPPLPAVAAQRPPRMASTPPPPEPEPAGETIVAQDGRDSSPPTSDRHVRMYRGRRVVDE